MSPRIRKVLTSDLDEILEISQHIWEGHDYLPFVIKDWLKDPNSHTYGIDVNNRIVAVANLRVIEEGRTGWMEGLRVHPDHTGKGYANILTEHIIKKAKTLNVHRIRYTTSWLCGPKGTARLHELPCRNFRGCERQGGRP